MIRHDPNTHFYRVGIIFRQYFVGRDGKPVQPANERRQRWNKSGIQAIKAKQRVDPVEVLFSSRTPLVDLPGRVLLDKRIADTP